MLFERLSKGALALAAGVFRSQKEVDVSGAMMAFSGARMDLVPPVVKAATPALATIEDIMRHNGLGQSFVVVTAEDKADGRVVIQPAPDEIYGDAALYEHPVTRRLCPF